MKQMNKKRSLGVLLFSLAGLIVWFSFVFITEGFSLSLDSDVLFGAFSATLSAVVSSYIISPRIYFLTKTRGTYGNAFAYGFIITLLSFLIGSFIFCIELIDGESPDFFEYVFLSLFGFGYSVYMMSPGLILGGITGVLLYYLSNKFDLET